jgi:hypothetical protein
MTLRFERITGIQENTVLEPVYDLNIEGSPSFFANGLAVHNTHWAVWDLYTYIEENDPSVEVLKRSIYEPDDSGKQNIIWPERWSWTRIEQLKKEFGSMFPLLYLNEPFDPTLVDFNMDKVRGFEMFGEMVRFQQEKRDNELEDKLSASDVLLTPEVQAKAAEARGRRMRGQRLTPENFKDVFDRRNEYVRAKFK